MYGFCRDSADNLTPPRAAIQKVLHVKSVGEETAFTDLLRSTNRARNNDQYYLGGSLCYKDYSITYAPNVILVIMAPI